MRTPFSFLALPVALALAAACGGSTPAPTAPPSAEVADAGAPSTPAPTAAADAAPAEPAPAATAATPAPEPKPEPKAEAKAAFKEMTRDQKIEHMKKVVMPGMAEVFKGADGKKFAEVKCVTCHGEGSKQGKFDMPNPKLPKLSFTDGFKKHMTKDPKMTKFMMEKVTPEMVKLLGTTAYDPKTKTGFGCMGCHVVGP